MSDDMNLGAEQEYDFSGDKTPARDVTVQITDVEENPAGDKGGVRLEISFSGEDLPSVIKVKEWIRHPNETAQRIGRNNLRKIAKAATGNEGFTKSSLVGSFVKAKLDEDDNGFLRLTRFGKAESQVSL